MTDSAYNVSCDPVIQVKDIRKVFGVLQALSGVSFELHAGEFLTVFGPNGAGKTTLIKILSGLTRPTSGVAMVAGYDVIAGDPRLRRELGVIAHASCLYADLSALENLVFYANMYGLENPKEKASQAIEEVGLKNRMHDRIRTFSRGMQQRISIARAVLHDPSVLFLDEPFTGLDPHGSNILKEYLHSLHTEKRTIIMTTHDLSCGLEMSDKIAVQARGRFVLFENVDKLDKHRFEELYFDTINNSN
ncbi:MAG: ABC transporter ATP-binding protein [Nitrospinaceae bacterium]|nr:MAG: ABC transporter ATP-binding protein [Nitrospinaceae bacterium]